MRCIYFLFIFVCTTLYTQELPPIIIYPPSDSSHIFIIVAESRTRAKEFAKEREEYNNIEPEEMNTHEEDITLEFVV